MKKLLLAIPAIMLAFVSNAQNVGIGTPAPDKLLHLKGAGEILRIQGAQPWIGFMNNTDADYKGFLYYPDTALVMGSAPGSNQPLVLAPNNNGLLFANAQERVGIGTASPTEKLDVNGNINLAGNLKLNNTAGQPNQVLMTNSTGNTVWADYCEFKNFSCFQLSGGASWTVPANITRVMIEAWGAGGGGASGGGGGSGAFFRYIISVVPGQLLNMTVGSGGAGATTEAGSAAAGGTTMLPNGTPVTGGTGATASSPGKGADGVFSNNYLIYGNNGLPTTETYAQRNSTEWVTIRKYGDGGKAVLLNSSEGTGSSFTFNTNTLLNISLKGSLEGSAAGAGGGGGPNNGLLWGSNGADGMIVIRY